MSLFVPGIYMVKSSWSLHHFNGTNGHRRLTLRRCSWASWAKSPEFPRSHGMKLYSSSVLNDEVMLRCYAISVSRSSSCLNQLRGVNDAPSRDSRSSHAPHTISSAFARNIWVGSPKEFWAKARKSSEK